MHSVERRVQIKFVRKNCIQGHKYLISNLQLIFQSFWPENSVSFFLLTGWAILIFDFAENYTCRSQDEVG